MLQRKLADPSRRDHGSWKHGRARDPGNSDGSPGPGCGGVRFSVSFPGSSSKVSLLHAVASASICFQVFIAIPVTPIVAIFSESKKSAPLHLPTRVPSLFLDGNNKARETFTGFSYNHPNPTNRASFFNP